MPTKKAVAASEYKNISVGAYESNWLKTPTTPTNYSSSVRNVKNDGNVGHNYAYNGSGGVVPVLNLKSGIFISGEGTESNPYIMYSGTTTPIAVSSITLNKSKTTIQQGQTEQLIATINPENATNKNVIWSVTSGGNVATVSTTGLVTAVNEGMAVVRVASADDSTKYAECAVTVNPQDLLTMKIENVSTQKEFRLGSNAKVTIKVTNNTETTNEVTLIIALFDNNNKFIKYVVTRESIESKKVAELTGTLEIPKNGDYKLKCFVWDTLENMKPLSKAFEIPVK